MRGRRYMKGQYSLDHRSLLNDRCLSSQQQLTCCPLPPPRLLCPVCGHLHCWSCQTLTVPGPFSADLPSVRSCTKSVHSAYLGAAAVSCYMWRKLSEPGSTRLHSPLNLSFPFDRQSCWLADSRHESTPAVEKLCKIPGESDSSALTYDRPIVSRRCSSTLTLTPLDPRLRVCVTRFSASFQDLIDLFWLN